MELCQYLALDKYTCISYCCVSRSGFIDKPQVWQLVLYAIDIIAHSRGWRKLSAQIDHCLTETCCEGYDRRREIRPMCVGRGRASGWSLCGPMVVANRTGCGCGEGRCCCYRWYLAESRNSLMVFARSVR